MMPNAFQEILSEFEHLSNTEIIMNEDFLDDVMNADLYIGDYSSTVVEFALTAKPLIYTPCDVILNEIGESIRGEKITYSITLTSTGHWGSATAPAGDVITWTMDYSAFSKLVKIGTKRLTVMDTFAASKQLEEMWINQTSDNMLAQLDGQKQNSVSLFQRKEWDISQINQYESFHSYAKRSRKDKGGKKIFYNRGQTLEAYFRWLAGQGPGIKYIRDKAMAETAANNLPFYAGGDLENVQIKGMNASVANIDTMITVLQETQAQLHLIIAESEKLSQDTSKVDVSKINSNIDTAIKSLLNKYGFK